MQQWIFKSLIIFLLIGVFLPDTLADKGDKKDFTKTIKKEFEIERDGEVELSNQFGKLEVNTWDKNRVKIAITIIARTDTESSAQDIFDRISVDFSNSADFVRAETRVSSSKGSWWGGWNNSDNFVINYDVLVPETANLNIENRHGNTYIAPMKGDGNLDIAHGSITSDGFEGVVDIDFAHSNGSIRQARILKGEIAHTNIRLGRLGDVDLETAHGNIDIDRAREIRLDAQHTNFDIGEADEILADTRHCNFDIIKANAIASESQHSIFKIEALSKAADFDFSHGGATIDYLSEGFSEVSLVGSHANYKIRLDNAAAFELDARGSHAGIRYPDGMDIDYKKDKYNEQEIRGSRGNGSKGIIRARLSHGGLRLR